MTHFIVMSFFAGLVAIVFGVVSHEGRRARLLYGLKVFVQFIGAGLLLGWLLYFLPL
ncbi:MAG: hypothetical protein ABR577_06660 [Pyrinomonadaceae bacterium]